MQELHALCPSEMRLGDSGVFVATFVSVLWKERKLAEPGSFAFVFSVCEESLGEDDVCLADKWRMMLHWSEIISLSHCNDDKSQK